MFSENHKEFDITEPNCVRCSRKAKDFVRPNTQRAKSLGVLDQLGKKTDLFSELFVIKDKLTYEEVMKVLKFDDDVSEKNKECLNRFLQKCSESKLQEFLLFVTASKQLPLVSKITVKEDNSYAIFGHTCVFTIILSSFSTYEDF